MSPNRDDRAKRAEVNGAGRSQEPRHVRPRRPATASALPRWPPLAGDGPAACNILGWRQRFDAVPFFWTEQYDFALAYVGHAERWDKAEIDGQLDARDCMITYQSGGRKLAVAVIRRDLKGLRAEVEFERAIPTSGGGPSWQQTFRSAIT